MPNNEDINLVDLAVAQHPTAFMDAVNSILQQKAATALEQIRPMIAQGIYGDDDETEDDDISDDDDDTSDDDGDDDALDDDDLEDLGWDSLEGTDNDD